MSYNLILNPGKNFRALRHKKNKYSNSCVVRNFFFQRNKNPYPPPPLQAKWSVPNIKNIRKFFNNTYNIKMFFNNINNITNIFNNINTITKFLSKASYVTVENWQCFFQELPMCLQDQGNMQYRCVPRTSTFLKSHMVQIVVLSIIIY